MADPSGWTLPLLVPALAVAALVIALAGARLAAVADLLADRTGLGEAFTGAVLLGASTSLPGLATSVTAAWEGHADLAIGNCVGGIAAQTMFLALADFFQRRANLEHAGASLPNLVNSVLLVCLLGFVLLAADGPAWSVGHVHVATPLLVVGYLAGLRLVRVVHRGPLWEPVRTRETRTDEPAERRAGEPSTAGLWVRFAALGAVLAVAGWAVGQLGIGLTARTGLSGTLVGTLFTSIATSLPELFTAIAAVRRQALTLAVGDIVGGNLFDVLFLAAADLAYRPGSLYGAFDPRHRFLVALAILQTATLLLGLIRREEHGFANIGFESLLLLVFWVGGMAVLAAGG